MATIAPVTRQRFFDESGEPLSGGKIYTYEAGTTTLKATYKDEDNIVPHTNPIILDSEGYAPDKIYLNGSYKIVYFDQSDVLSHEDDNVSSDNLETTAEKVSFTQDSVNAPIIVDANAIFRRKLHIMDFVPKSQWSSIENQDTASQDPATVTAGVLNALREMKARKTELDCGYGRFLVEGMALSAATDCLIYGGEFQLDYQAYGANTHIFDLQNSCSDVFFDKIHFIGTSDSSATYDATNRYGGIEVNDSAHVVIERSKFSKFTSYGAFGKNLTGGTFTEGLLIDRCRFLDFPYDSGTPFQAGVILGDDGEYTTVTNCRFYRVPSAARFTDGANSIFSHNIAMDLNGGYGTDRAAFYSEQGTNSGKLQVTHNKFNHIETGQIVVFMKNDPTKPQNIQILESNELLVNGSVTHSQQVVMNDCPNAKVLNNNIRPNNVVAGEQCLRLNDCDGATVETNHFDGGDYSITIDNGTVNLGHNTYNSPATGKINLRGTGAFKVTTGRSYSIRVSGSGSAGTPNDKAWTSSKIATGHYQVTHNIGDTNYSASVEIDNSSTALLRTSVVRSANTIDVYIADSAGTLTDSAHLVNVTVGVNNEYAL